MLGAFLTPDSVRPHPEEPRSGVSKDGGIVALMVRDGAARLLTMRV